MTQFIRLVDWDHLQHYKDRDPRWIKLYRDVLASEMWAGGDDATRVLGIACMLLAATTGNNIPYNGAYIRRVAYLNQDPDFSHLLAARFLEIVDDTQDASNTLAGRYQDARAEKRREKESERREETPSSKPEPGFDLSGPGDVEDPREKGSNQSVAGQATLLVVPKQPGKDERTEHRAAVHEVFQYYLEKARRKSKTYSLTPLRMNKGLARLSDCLTRTRTLQDAVSLLKLAVDGLTASDWHMGRHPQTAGKRYCDWETHLFGSTEKLEKNWERAEQGRRNREEAGQGRGVTQ